MKQFYFPLIALIFFAWTLQVNAQVDSVSLECSFPNVGKTLHLYSFNGFYLEKVATASAQEEGTFSLKVPSSDPRFYHLGADQKNTKLVILGPEKTVKIQGKGKILRSAQFMGSKLNKQYLQLRGVLSKHMVSANRKGQEYVRAYRAKEEDKMNDIVASLKEMDQEKMALLDSLREEDEFLYTIAGLNTLLSYQNNKGAYRNEVEYFGNESFRFVDLTNANLTGNAELYDAYRSYAQALSSIRVPDQIHLAFMQSKLKPLEAKPEVYQMALGGILGALERANHPNYVPLAQAFLDKYENLNPTIVKLVHDRMTVIKGVSIGGEAPNFSQKTPDGTDFGISDLRGKVVLIDFWASWCGPCRKENPNVVNVYNKYKDKGFEIIGVSLDNNKDRWLKAIKDDGLTWHHVSDLRGWSNAVAKMYGVKSIPKTFLIDQEGKVLAKNLRGPALQQKLEELLGVVVNGAGER